PKLSDQPLLTARLSDLSLEGPGAVWSGLQLRQPLKLAYSVLPGAGWLRLDPTTLEFFHKVAKTGPKRVQGTLKLEAAFVAMENPGLKKAASKDPDQHIKAWLQDLPVQNLAFLVPGLSKIGGTIRNLDLSSTGPLSRPRAQLSVSAQNVQIQGLNITAAQGIASLTGESPGRMRLNFGEGADELRFLLGAENDLTQSLRFQGQALLDFDRVILMKSPTLVSSLRGWALTERSEFDLRAQLNDSQMRLFSAIAPDQSQLSGALTGGLQLKGTSGKPELTGSLALNNGSYAHPSLSTPLSGVNLLARFERINVSDAEANSNLAQIVDTTLGRVTLEKLEGNLGGQAFQGKGKAEMAGRLPTFLDFHLDGDDLPIDWDGLMEGRANIHLNLTGIAKDTGGLKPLLTGRIDIPQATLSMPDEEFRNRLLALSIGRKRWLDYNIDLALGNDVWGGYLGSTIRATGDLKFTPSLTGNRPAVNGELFLSRGVIRIPVYEVNFRIRQGYAYFEDDLIPRLENLEADSTLGTYQLTARFDGKYPKIQADVVANPPLPESDLRRLVGLGGLPVGNTSTSLSSYGANTNANSFLVNQGVSILSNMLTGALSQGLGRLLFASEVSFDILPTSEYVVRLAKSLTENDDFLLTFAQVIGTTRFNTTLSQYGFEWRFQPNLLTRITLDNYGQAKLWFQGVLRF
ncbi:translocation/assembly module TamB domain-containing protein, partial [bacterium]|nr:translocation/assembly module TamB domain-containing protein [bacterium]